MDILMDGGISIHAPRVGSDPTGPGRPYGGTYFNPRSPCGERPQRPGPGVRTPGISIHAPRVGSDWDPHGHPHGRRNFNPRSPCGERQMAFWWSYPPPHFNPRSPCGERPSHLLLSHIQFIFQSTLPVWGATPPDPAGRLAGRISIHAPRVGSDTPVTKDQLTRGEISIHAPRVGSDRGAPWASPRTTYFNPRSPCGERPRR